MPIWTNEAPADPRGPAFPIRRTPPTGSLEAVVTCVQMIGTFTHFFHNRTTPHETDQCEACLKGIPYRWHAYVSAWEPRTGLHFIFETTAQASDPFKDYFKTFDTLRGCHFIATRMAKRTNGRVIIRTKPADMSGLCVPEPPDLKQCLAIIWGLPADTLDTTT